VESTWGFLQKGKIQTPENLKNFGDPVPLPPIALATGNDYKAKISIAQNMELVWRKKITSWCFQPL